MLLSLFQFCDFQCNLAWKWIYTKYWNWWIKTGRWGVIYCRDGWYRICRSMMVNNQKHHGIFLGLFSHQAAIFSAPPTPTSRIITKSWLQSILNHHQQQTSRPTKTIVVQDFQIKPLDENRGLVGNVDRIHVKVTHENQNEKEEGQEQQQQQEWRLIIKYTQPQQTKHFISTGWSGIREAEFYQYAQKQQQEKFYGLPKIWYTQVSKWSCDSLVIMNEVGFHHMRNDDDDDDDEMKEETQQPQNQSSFTNTGTNNNVVAVNHCFGNQCWGLPSSAIKGVAMLEQYLLASSSSSKQQNNQDERDISSLAKLEILKQMYSFAAHIHAKHWNAPSLICNDSSSSSLRMKNWYQGHGRTSWELSIETCRRGWIFLSQTKTITFPNGFLNMIFQSLDETSWKNFQQFLKHHDYTLTHGDFHAANMMYSLHDASTPNKEEEEEKNQTKNYIQEGNAELFVLDWSEVGPYEPYTDLAQTIISDVPRSLFSHIEENVLKEVYFAEMVRKEILNESDWEHCRDRFGRGGMEKWIWVMGILGCLLNQGVLPPKFVQYCIDQMHSFWQTFCPHVDAFALKTCGSTMIPTQ